MLAAIILAAGDSTRMRRPKALLPDPDGRPFVARVVRAFSAADISDVVIVTGSQHAAIVDAIAADRPPITPVFVTNLPTGHPSPRSSSPTRGPRSASSRPSGLDSTPRRSWMSMVYW